MLATIKIASVFMIMWAKKNNTIEQELLTILSNMQDTYYCTDANGVILRASDSVINLLGYTPDEIIGTRLIDYYEDPSERTKFLNALMASGGQVTNFETCLRRKDDSIVWVSTNAHVLYDEQGNIAGVEGTTRDITERKCAEEALRQSEARFRKIYQSSPALISINRVRDGQIIDVNPAWLNACGWLPHEVIGRTFLEINLWANVQEREKIAAMLQEHGAVHNADWRFRTKTGEIRHMLGSIEPIVIINEECLLIVAQDISQRKHSEEQQQKLSRALEQIADAVMITNCDGVIEYVNPAFESITGYCRDEVLGCKPSIINSGRQGLEFHQKMWQTILAGENFQDVFINRRKDGSLYYEEKTITPLKDAAGVITHFVSTGKDITERMLTQERLQYLAHHDALTDLPNRSLFLDRLKHALSRIRWHYHLVAVMFIDLDRFKVINDSLGHNTGDQLLQLIAIRLRTSIRSGDTVARLGGDEFAVLLDDIESELQVALVAQKILDVLKSPFLIEGRDLYITASIGITLAPRESEDSQVLLKNADIAMYCAKELGKNNYQFFSSEMNAQAIERLTMENSLRQALEKNEFELYYQPQIDVRSNNVVGVEALLRWRHPQLGTVLPSEFIPLLEETGLIVNVGEWLLKATCIQAKEWRRQGFGDLRMAINLSNRQFYDNGFVRRVEDCLTKQSIDPCLLEFEITESAIMGHAETTSHALSALNRLGVCFALDDFGTGYSSLSYLQRFPIHTLKIDKTFIRNIPQDADDAALSSAVIQMAHSLNLGVIAEGVETEEQREYLFSRGCHIMQGNLFGYPAPANEMTRFLEAKRLDKPSIS